MIFTAQVLMGLIGLFATYAYIQSINRILLELNVYDKVLELVDKTKETKENKKV